MLAEHNSAQLCFFRNSNFGKCLSKKYFQFQKSWIIFENINLSGNCLKSLLLCSSSTTQHNFPFSEILIFENFCSKNISKFKKVGLFLKILIWVEIVLRVFYFSRRAQLSTIFLFSKFSFLKFFDFFLGDLVFENHSKFGICACGTILSAFNTAQHKFSFPEKTKWRCWDFFKKCIAAE